MTSQKWGKHNIRRTNPNEPEMRGKIELRFRTKDGINDIDFAKYSKPTRTQGYSLFVIGFIWELKTKNQTIETLKGIIKALEELPQQETQSPTSEREQRDLEVY